MSYNISLTKAKSQSYTIALKNAHGTLYYDDYLWVLMFGNFPQNPVKIDKDDLSSYSGPTSNEPIGTTQIVYAKGYMWSTKNQNDMIIRRTNISDPTTVVDFDGTGETAESPINSGMVYDSATECIFIGAGASAAGAGFVIIDISDVDVPVFTFYAVDGVLTGFEHSSFHSMCSDGTYIYMSYKYKESIGSDPRPAVLKVKASDPTEGGVTGWDWNSYSFDQLFTDDSFYYDGYIYFATDPIATSYPYIAKINATTLALDSSISVEDTLNTACYGVWQHEGLLFAAVGTSPGKIKVYDMDFDLLHTHTFSDGYNLPNELIFNDDKLWVTFWSGTSLVIQELNVIVEELPMSWDDTTLSTTASLAKIEREINNLIESSGTEYLSDGFNIAVASGNTSSVDVTGGMIEIVGKVATVLSIKDGKALTVTIQDSADDVTFATIYTGGILYTKTASGTTAVAAGTELFRYVAPTNIEDYVRCVVTSDATNTGTLDIYTASKWAEKIAFAKDKLKNKLNTWLVMRGYQDYPDYDNDEVLIDIISNPSEFAMASDLLTCHYIFRDLATGKGDDHIYYLKSQEYKADFEEEFNEAVRRIKLDKDQDGTADKDTPEDWELKLVL